mgnify:CR=1 FL=1
MSAQVVIAYHRRSTDKGQKHSISRQRDAIEKFIRANDLTLVTTFEETASGSNMNRDELKKALALSAKIKAPIIVSSLSRLGRNAGEVIALMDEQEIIVADRGLSCSKMVLSILAVIDQNERERISQRTRDGMASAKKRGVVFGNPKILEAQALSRKAIVEGADAFALVMADLIVPLLNAGRSANSVATQLNDLEIKTRRGGRWTHRTVLNIVDRLEAMK